MTTTWNAPQILTKALSFGVPVFSQHSYYEACLLFTSVGIRWDSIDRRIETAGLRVLVAGLRLVGSSPSHIIAVAYGSFAFVCGDHYPCMFYNSHRSCSRSIRSLRR